MPPGLDLNAAMVALGRALHDGDQLSRQGLVAL